MHNRTTFKITLEEGQFILDAGVMAGITEGAEFVVHPSTDSLFKDPLGVLVVDKLRPFSTILKVPPGGSKFVLSQPQAVALRTKMGQRFDLRLYVPDDDAFRLCRKALLLLMNPERDFESIYLVDKPDDADFELAMENEKVIFFFRDQRVTQHGHTRLFEGVESVPEELAHVLKAAAYFYWKLNRTNNNPVISSGVQVELYKLLPPNIRRFNEDGDGLKPIGPNLYGTVMEVVADENIPYGFKLTNNTAYDLYLNVFYFDLSDLSIGESYPRLSTRRLFNSTTLVAYYETSSTAEKYTLDVPLPKDGGVFTIGYGSGGAPAQTFYLRPGQIFDIGFLKIFLSTKPVDLSSIPQLSPFEKTRSGDQMAKNKEEAWGTMIIPVLQRLSDPASLGVTQQTLRIQGLEAENVALKREIDILHEIGAQRQEEAQRQAQALLALKTELQHEKAERQRLETLLQERAEPHAALDKRSPELHRDKTPVSGGWHLKKKFRWW